QHGLCARAAMHVEWKKLEPEQDEAEDEQARSLEQKLVPREQKYREQRKRYRDDGMDARRSGHAGLSAASAAAPRRSFPLRRGAHAGEHTSCSYCAGAVDWR